MTNVVKETLEITLRDKKKALYHAQQDLALSEGKLIMAQAAIDGRQGRVTTLEAEITDLQLALDKVTK